MSPSPVPSLEGKGVSTWPTAQSFTKPGPGSSLSPWDWFLTLTFREPVPSFTAHRRFARFAHDIEQAAGLPVAWFRVSCFYPKAYGPAGGRLHVHALMLNTAALSRLFWMDRWRQRNGYARLFPFDPAQGAAFYCSKYVTKASGDWDVSDNLAGFRVQQTALFGGNTARNAPQ